MLTKQIADRLNLPLEYNVSVKRRIRVISLEELLNTLIEHKTAKDAAIALGISRSTITDICRELFPAKESKQTWSQFLFSTVGCKRCSKCGETKPLDEFADSKDKGKHIMCRPCLHDYGSVRYFSNKEQHREWNSTWRANNPAKANAISAKRRANKANALTETADLDLIKLIYEGCPTGYQVDHVTPIAKGGLHHEDNLCYLPASLNAAKKDKMPDTVPEIMQFAIYPLEETEN